MKHDIERAFYGFAIPALWQASGHYPAVMDTGRDCQDKDKHENLESACYNGRLYTLGSPEKGKNVFQSLRGVDEMKDGAWGGITVEDLIIG